MKLKARDLLFTIGGGLLALGAHAGYQHVSTYGYTPSTSMPAALRQLNDQDFRITPLESPVSGFTVHELTAYENPESTSVLAISTDKSAGYVIGELFDADGQPVSSTLLGNAALNSLRYDTVGLRSDWYTAFEGDPTLEPVYLMTDMVSPKSRMLFATALQQQARLPELRVIPTPFTSVQGFETVLELFTASHTPSGVSAKSMMMEFLTGERQPSPERIDMPNPGAVSSLTKNSNLQYQLRTPDEPTVLALGNDGGVEMKPFKEWLIARVGQ